MMQIDGLSLSTYIISVCYIVSLLIHLWFNFKPYISMLQYEEGGGVISRHRDGMLMGILPRGKFKPPRPSKYP